VVVLDGATVVSGTVGAAAVVGGDGAATVVVTASVSVAVTPSPTVPDAMTSVHAPATRDAPTTEAIRRTRTAQR
jgi:hypothetical protein